MKLHYFQHVPFENLASIELWAKNNNFHISSTKFYQDYNSVNIDTIDWLVIMGGPMGIYQDNLYPWLTKEKKYIEKAIKENKIVIGICLGAQLIADVLGAKVYKNKYKEIGWYPVFKSEIIDNTIANIFPNGNRSLSTRT